MEGGGDAHSQNLRSFLRVKEEEPHHHLQRGPGVTLNTVLSDKRGPGETLPRAPSNRTLLDIIREESVNNNNNNNGKKSWRHFKDKLRLRRTGSGSGSSWISSVPIPASDIPLRRNSAESTRPVSGRFEHTSSLAMRRLQRERNEYYNEEEQVEDQDNEDEEEEEGRPLESGGGEGESGQPVRMSLMALLAETDRQMGLDGSAFMMEEEDEEEDEEEEEDEGAAAAVEYNNCCVCMVRHKGAAFIPCGHTFCRLCSRELWAQRGNCPLCNNYILEILDIF